MGTVKQANSVMSPATYPRAGGEGEGGRGRAGGRHVVSALWWKPKRRGGQVGEVVVSCHSSRVVVEWPL
jgi:hypothetical protein